MLNVIMLNVVMLSIVMLSVIMLNVVILNVVMLSVMAPMNVPKLKHFNSIKFLRSHCVKKARLYLAIISFTNTISPFHNIYHFLRKSPSTLDTPNFGRQLLLWVNVLR